MEQGRCDGTSYGLELLVYRQDAQPTPELISILQQLASDPANHIVINSGRDHFTLEKWLGSLPVSMAAEHGAFYKENGVLHHREQNIEQTFKAKV